MRASTCPHSTARSSWRPAVRQGWRGASPRWRLATAAVQEEQAAATATPRAPRELVDQVLQEIEGTDGGIAMDDARRERVDELMEGLEEAGARQRPRPLDNPLLWGNYEVAYTSTRRAPTERGQPAGGRFRGTLGRTLFRTAGLYQSVLQPDIATNKVEFKLFGLIPGFVGLRGRVLPMGEDGDTVRVLFEPPVLSLGRWLHVRIGPPSSVVLTTTYLDERVRLGKGSRGSLFVFTRGGAADGAGMADVGLQRTSPLGRVLLGGALAGMLVAAGVLWATAMPLPRVLAGMLAAVAAALLAVTWRGGIVDDGASAEQYRRYVEQYTAAGGPQAA